jgi:hypothetical protein
MTIQIEILNPDARNLLDELAKLNLIRIKDLEEPKARFEKFLNKLRDKGGENLSLGDITKEIEKARTKRYEDGQK